MASYPVITSKRASNDFQKIKADHEELVRSLSNQSSKVAQYRQQQSANLAAENAMRFDQEKAKQAADTQAQKNAIDFNIKQGELDVKRASIATQN